MKRLMLRIGALVALVGVGVIAIAQAQRGASPAPAEGAAAAAPRLLPETSQSAKPIADLAKPRLPLARVESVGEIAAVAKASAADPFPQPTSHVVRAVGTTGEPIMVKDDATPAATVKAEIGGTANPLREPSPAVNVPAAATVQQTAAQSEPRMVPTLVRPTAAPEPQPATPGCGRAIDAVGRRRAHPIAAGP